MNTTEHGHRGAASALSRAARAEPIGAPNPAGRDSPAGSLLLALVVCVALSACAAPTLRIEAEHVSHPLVGFPFEPQGHKEDSVTQVNALLHWERSGWYADGGIGWNVLGRNGGQFYGPALTGTVRVGREFRLVKP